MDMNKQKVLDLIKADLDRSGFEGLVVIDSSQLDKGFVNIIEQIDKEELLQATQASQQPKLKLGKNKEVVDALANKALNILRENIELFPVIDNATRYAIDLIEEYLKSGVITEDTLRALEFALEHK